MKPLDDFTAGILAGLREPTYIIPDPHAVTAAIMRLAGCLRDGHPDTPRQGTAIDIMDAAVEEIEALRRALHIMAETSIRSKQQIKHNELYIRRRIAAAMEEARGEKP